MPLSDAEIKDLVAFGREQSGVEFKSAGVRTDSPFKGKIVRGMLAMANRRDGGLLLVGIREDANTQLKIEGLNSTQIATWKHDHIADTVAEYADPRVRFDSYVVEVDGLNVLVIAVSEFTDVPVVCKRALSDGARQILRDGAVYVRSNRKPESREVANYDEMRELLDIATDKGVRRFTTRASIVGLAIDRMPRLDDAVLFKQERGDL